MNITIREGMGNTVEYSEISNAAMEIIRIANINTLPVNLQLILDACNIVAMSFQESQRRKAWTRITNDGVSCFHKGSGKWVFTILYDGALPPCQVRWAIAIEFGHFVLKHHELSLITNQEDIEARYFATQLLMPLVMLRRFNDCTALEIADLCEVPLDAADSCVQCISLLYETNRQLELNAM